MPSSMEDYDSPPIGREIGSAFPYEQLFSGFENGKVFVYDSKPTVREFKEMLTSDGTSESIEKLLVFPILACKQEIVPASGDKGEAEFIHDLFMGSEHNGGMITPLPTVISQMTWAMTVRRTYFEKVFELRESDGKVVYRKLAWRPPETCELALHPDTGEHIGFRQQPMYFGPPASRRLPSKTGWHFIKKDRAFVYTHGTWRDPIDGISGMQVPYWVWQTKRKIRYLWYQYLETTSLPKTLVQNEDEGQAQRDAKKVASLRSRDVLALSADTQVNPYESSGKGAGQFIEAMRWLDGEAMKSILAAFMELSGSAAEGKGSFALSRDQSQLFLRTRKFVAADMAKQFTGQVIAPLVKYNFGPKAACPKFVFGPISQADEKDVIDIFGQITQVSQAQTLSKEFYDELTIRVASILELDEDAVSDSINEVRKRSPNPLAEMVNTTDLMSTVVQNGLNQQGGQQNEAGENG